MFVLQVLDQSRWTYCFWCYLCFSHRNIWLDYRLIDFMYIKQNSRIFRVWFRDKSLKTYTDNKTICVRFLVQSCKTNEPFMLSHWFRFRIKKNSVPPIFPVCMLSCVHVHMKYLCAFLYYYIIEQERRLLYRIQESSACHNDIIKR